MSDSILHPSTERLQSFAENLLDEAERAVVESHVLGCATCQSEVKEWRSLFSMLSELPQFEPSVHFADNVMRSVQLPDPWYVRALVVVGDRAQKYAPKTTRGWAFATAFTALPFAAFALFATWLLSKPYVNTSNVFAFVYNHVEAFASTVAEGALASILQTDIALAAARVLNVVSTADVGTAGAWLVGISVATAASAYVLYQNLFRANAHENQRYVTYSF